MSNYTPPAPPTLHRSLYWYWPMDAEGGPGEPELVEVTHTDTLRGELEGATKHKLPPMSQVPMRWTTLWVWAAMARTGRTELDSQTFLNSLYELLPVKRDDEAPGEGDDGVDPSRPVQPLPSASS